MSDMKCPYCGADQDVSHDNDYGYEEGVLHEHDCSECKKTFTFQTFISFSYESFKADCLNGAPHDLYLSRTYPRQYARVLCRNCRYERRATKEEISAAGDGE